MNPETPITLSVTLGEVNGILTGVAQLPYGQVASLIQKIQGQAESQARAAAPAPAPAPAPEAEINEE